MQSMGIETMQLKSVPGSRKWRRMRIENHISSYAEPANLQACAYFYIFYIIFKILYNSDSSLAKYTSFTPTILQ